MQARARRRALRHELLHLVHELAGRRVRDVCVRLDREECERSGTHEESGAYSVEGWLKIYANHSHDHANQIRAARG